MFAAKAVAHHSAKAGFGGFAGVVNGSSVFAEIFGKQFCLGGFSASVNALYYDKKSAFVFQNKKRSLLLF